MLQSAHGSFSLMNLRKCFIMYVTEIGTDEMLIPWPASREGLMWGHSLSFGLGQLRAALD